MQKGVILNAYPDSVGENLSGLIHFIEHNNFDQAFTHVYILPTLFNSDLDRGFSIIDYDLNESLVSNEDLNKLTDLNIKLKLDIVLNHLSVASPQFQDLLQKGDTSVYKDFFIDWNSFWKNNGILGADEIIQPKKEYLEKLFMRKDGLPILEVYFPDGSKRPYWNTFYQKTTFNKISPSDLDGILDSEAEKLHVSKTINDTIESGKNIHEIESLNNLNSRNEILKIIYQKSTYLGQMDLNAQSELVWTFYQDCLKKITSYGCTILRLDAFAYLHKSVGETNFFNKPGTWEYLDRFKEMATDFDLRLLPEIHAEYGSKTHEEVSNKGYMIYDFFLPGLIIYSIEYGDNNPLVKWIRELIEKKYETINMLGCHDGIPVLDLKGKEIDGVYREGLLSDNQIEEVVELILNRGGKIKNIFDAKGKKISYYQVNATYFSALGESEKKMLLARAIQLFVPGTPQVWYLDLFAGKNDYNAVELAGAGGHKEINRTNLSFQDIANGAKAQIFKKQMKLISLRNRLDVFNGKLTLKNPDNNKLIFTWKLSDDFAKLEVDFSTLIFCVSYSKNGKINREVFNA
ncbi:MAG: Sucrose 6(F)-phosphate phosphorylase [Bacteroidota bacterium]|nr:MAG: Sucrose 6(F)-phosphate phosphorylase [Bacteroidota bacterium]